MAGWRRALARIASDAEKRFDTLKERFDARMGSEPLQIVAYDGYGTSEALALKGRVLEDQGIAAASDRDSVWRNLANMYRRFASDEVPGAHLLAEFDSATCEAMTDAEGYFDIAIAPPRGLPADRSWHPIALTLLDSAPPDGPPVRAIGQVLVPPPSARFGVISDIDDTVIRTDSTNLLRMARTVFLRNARTRLPLHGVAALYRALNIGASGLEANPIFYVSSSPWNLYDLLVDFFALQGIPRGPLLLRDWGLGERASRPTAHHDHKLHAIAQVLDRYPALPFLLIGDSGQADPEIYAEVDRRYPQRILAIYIRSVIRSPRRLRALGALVERVSAGGSALVIADDSRAIARHAAAHSWIAAADLAAIEADTKADE
jgi:phosphatidate phosphatase APP1